VHSDASARREWKCPECGCLNVEEDDVCDECGYDLNDDDGFDDDELGLDPEQED